MSRPDFPKTIFEFNQHFSTEEACLRFLLDSRWPDGFICPKCGHNEYYWLPNRKLLQCKSCKYQVSATAGTVMHRSKQPLTVWFYAAYLVTTIGPGMSAKQFQRQTGIKNYQTAFMMLHKLRAGLVNEGRTKLTGLVQVDETYIGGEKPGLRGRGAAGKVIVAGAAEMKGKAVSRIRLRVIPDVKSETLNKFVSSVITKGSTVVTDDWNGYNNLPKEGYVRVIEASDLVNLHRIFSNLKTWLMGTHHGVSKQHLQAYLNEFTFRFNRHVTPMAAFQTALGLGSKKKGPTYEELYGVAKQYKTAWVHPNPKR